MNRIQTAMIMWIAKASVEAKAIDIPVDVIYRV